MKFLNPYKYYVFHSTLSLMFFILHSTQFEFAHGLLPSIDINNNVVPENPTPIVGILTQEVSRFVLRKYPDNYFTSYIAASYVKFIEGAGGRVVPIWIGKSRDYYEDVLSKVNGVLLPGGATFFNQSQGYAAAGTHIYEIAIEMNKRGIYMPIWGTCLGFELLVYLTSDSVDARTSCASSAQALPLEFKDGYQDSRLFGKASSDVIKIFKNYPVTANFHMYCFTPETFANRQLDNIWNVLSVNHDWNGVEFISSVEHKIYPFYGVQFHPEKNLYEFVPNRNITHISLAIRSSQYMADFFVNEARRNTNAFKNKTEETASLIYNYNPRYTGALGSAFVQQYLFEDTASTTDSQEQYLDCLGLRPACQNLIGSCMNKNDKIDDVVVVVSAELSNVASTPKLSLGFWICFSGLYILFKISKN